MLQQTLMHAINYTGIGLHSGKDVEMKLLPAKIDAGISFHIHDKKEVSVIKPNPFVVAATELATTFVIASPLPVIARSDKDEAIF